MRRSDLVAFIRLHRWAVEASVHSSGAPEAAVMGVVVTDELELFFDTLGTSRKCGNLRRDSRVAFVIGWDEDQTVQYEGVADEPAGSDLERLKALYVAKFPEGVERERWPEITYWRARPRWVRYSDFRREAPRVVEFTEADLRG